MMLLQARIVRGNQTKMDWEEDVEIAQILQKTMLIFHFFSSPRQIPLWQWCLARLKLSGKLPFAMLPTTLENTSSLPYGSHHEVLGTEHFPREKTRKEENHRRSAHTFQCVGS